MEIEKRKDLEQLKNEVFWFGKVFVLSEGGREWRKAEDLKYHIATWADFYLGIEEGELEKLCKRLLSFSLSSYDKERLEQQIADLILELKALTIIQTTTSRETRETWPLVPLYSYTMQKYDLQLNRLFDLDVIYDAPWNSPDPSNPSLIHISADNMFYKDCLLAVYTQLLENIKSTGLDGKNELLQENEILKRKIQSEKEEEGYKEDTPEAVNLVFRMVLMYQLGILDKSKWPEKATQDQISRILATILGSEQSPVKTTSIKRYLKALMNGDYEGKKIRDKYDQKVREFLKNSFLS